ncbi:hypothetical protein Cph01nite_10980 [Cellulomonas phragmiteti]|uniref:AB hydrolase-1 domain-containing protein n=1 Tax=Cellulomonas phragmiteti TaxID=478780 RepID=A0ABQ4DK79_9CELL|nr:hypothetical protein Cph01nite_10980 [Cellulomonas phragmiteti]
MLRGARTRLRVYGHADAPCVVLLHGYRGDHHGLEPIVAHLTGLRVVVPDLPGFGGSGPFATGAHDVAAYAAWARDLLTAVAPEGRAVLAGHSFGSIVAAAALSGHGRPAARGLVLVNPVARSALAGRDRVAVRGTVLLHHAAGRLPERAGTWLLRHPALTRATSALMVTTSDRALRRWIHDEHDRHFSTFADRRTLLGAFDASVTGGVAAFASRVTAPTLLVAGDRDRLAPPADQRALVRLFPDARLVVLPGVGHLTHYEAPDAVARALASFVAGVQP